MATLKEKIMVETKVRELLSNNGMPEPDEVEYGYGCIRLFFNDPKVVLVVDIDDPGDDYALGIREVDLEEADNNDMAGPEANGHDIERDPGRPGPDDIDW